MRCWRSGGGAHPGLVRAGACARAGGGGGGALVREATCVPLEVRWGRHRTRHLRRPADVRTFTAAVTHEITATRGERALQPPILTNIAKSLQLFSVKCESMWLHTAGAPLTDSRFCRREGGGLARDALEGKDVPPPPERRA